MDEDIEACRKIPIDVAAFERILIKYDPLIRQTIRPLVWSASLRDDAYQEAVIRIMKQFPRYEEKYTLEAWLHTITRCACLDLLRKEYPTTKKGETRVIHIDDDLVGLLAGMLDDEIDPDTLDGQERMDLAEAWESATRDFPDRLKLKVFEWRVFGNKKMTTISKRLKIPYDTLKNWPAATAKKLRPAILTALREKGWDIGSSRMPGPQNDKGSKKKSKTDDLRAGKDSKNEQNQDCDRVCTKAWQHAQ